ASCSSVSGRQASMSWRLAHRLYRKISPRGWFMRRLYRPVPGTPRPPDVQPRLAQTGDPPGRELLDHGLVQPPDPRVLLGEVGRQGGAVLEGADEIYRPLRDLGHR